LRWQAPRSSSLWRDRLNRLAFVTDEAPADEIAGTSSVIGTYNQFAATQAALNTNLPTAPTAPNRADHGVEGDCQYLGR